MANAYCTLPQAKAGLMIDDTDADALLQLSVNAASRWIDGYCDQRFYVDSALSTREFYSSDGRSLPIDVGISTTTGLVVAIDTDGDGTFETTLTIATDFILKPTNAPDDTPVRPYTEIWLANNYLWPCLYDGRPGAQVTAKFGWPAVPDDVTMACVLAAQDLYKAKDAPFGVAGAADFGALRITQNRTVLNLLQPYRRYSVG